VKIALWRRSIAASILTAILCGMAAMAEAAETSPPAQSRERQFEKERMSLEWSRRSLGKLRDSDSEAFLDRYLASLEEQQRLVGEFSDLRAAGAARNQLAQEYLLLGHFARFRLAKTNRAMLLYESARANGSAFADFAIADMLQFDLGDKQAALARFQAILAANEARSGTQSPTVLSLAANIWLRHQIEYLEHGTRVEGRVPVDQCTIVGAVLAYGAANQSVVDPLGVAPFGRWATIGLPGAPVASEPQRREIAAALGRLPPSSVTLASTANLIGALPSADSILEYLRKNDPAGYATTCYLEIVERGRSSGGGEIVLAAADQYMKARPVPSHPPDARLSSPEKTWRLMIGSLKAGDAETARICFTEEQRIRMGPAFELPFFDKFRVVADTLATIELAPDVGDGIRLARIAGERANTVRFVLKDGEWQIDRM
jgi:hypothetical protein